MNIRSEREMFEAKKEIYESVKVTFSGVDGMDVYNPSIPFERDGKRYMYGRVEHRDEWANSWVRLFEEVSLDHFKLVDHSMMYQLEDPYVALVGEVLILGGTHVRKKQNEIDTYYGYFYKGKGVNDQTYFTTGPDYMKDIRLVELNDGKIGVFSRPRSEKIKALYGSESVVGFDIIDSIEDLNAEIVENAPVVEGLFEPDEWGGCNQAYMLTSGKIGVIGHKCYKEERENGLIMRVYLNVSFVFDMDKHQAEDLKIIGTRSCYPEGPAKKEDLADCVFTTGIVKRDDGKVDLYSGIGDTEVGRIVIDNPFAEYGEIL